MAKTPEELNVIKEEVEALNKKLAELTEEELVLVVGGKGNDGDIDWSVVDQSVPVTNSDPCPRCHQMTIWKTHNVQGEPIGYVCHNEKCRYMYSPPEWESNY